MDSRDRKILIGLKIKNYRKQRGYTQEKLYEALNMDVSGLSKIETGKNYPSTETVCDIMSLLKISPNEFFDFIEYEDLPKDLTDNIIYEQVKQLTPKNKQKVLDFIKMITD